VEITDSLTILVLTACGDSIHHYT